MAREEQTGPYSPGWWGVGLEVYRECQGTYELYDVATLPTAPALGDLATFSFLEQREDPGWYGVADVRAWVQAVSNALNLQNTPAPTGFELFYSEPWRLAAVPSCTDCYFMLDQEFITLEADPGVLYLPFYVDSQGCVYWSLRFDGASEPVVVAGEFPRDQDGGLPALVVCASSFAEFIWRWWIENAIWYAATGYGGELTDPLREYGERVRALFEG